jgi:hypothetical protein
VASRNECSKLAMVDAIAGWKICFYADRLNPVNNHRHPGQSQKVLMTKLEHAPTGRRVRLANVGLIRCLSTQLNSHRPVEPDSEETDGVLGTKIVLQQTVENLGLPGRSSLGRLASRSKFDEQMRDSVQPGMLSGNRRWTKCSPKRRSGDYPTVTGNRLS